MSYYLYNTPGTNIYNAIHHKSNPLPILGNPGHHTRPFSFINQEGQTITEKTSLEDHLERSRPGDKIALVVLRGKEKHTATLELKEWK